MRQTDAKQIGLKEVGNFAVPLGYGRFGRFENGLPVFSFSRS